MVKIGGATFGRHEPTVLDIGDVEDVVELQRRGKSLIIVHGGGKLITDWLTKQGISSRFVQGERVTDRATLEVAISVLAGLVNKEIVAAINSLGGQAVGISGVDGALIQGEVKNIELGYVGRVVKVNLAPLEALLQSGYIPVVAPLGLCSGPDQAPQILNINADVVAGEIAATIGAERLIFLTDVAGIYDEQGNLIPHLSPGETEALLASGVASEGMIPKLRACLRALSSTQTVSIIGGKTPHALLKEIEEGDVGTTIQPSSGVV
ncbi:Acetylglutamate kinase [subsurface metagenome]